MNSFKISNYQNKKTFTSFLPGIAGIFGKPLWSFYTNRGQAISSFGYQDKNGAILEFFPANTMYMYSKINGFKTYIKIDNQTYSFFDNENENQLMEIYQDKLIIKEYNEELKVEVIVTYFTLPNEQLSSLVRKVEIINRGALREIELLDGINQILPSGIGYGEYKAISNLLQSWMNVEIEKSLLLYNLRGSTEDSSIINEQKDFNFYLSKIDDKEVDVYADSKMIYGYDTSFQKPIENFKNLDFNNQVTVNQVPSGFSHYKGKIDKKITVTTIIGYSTSIQEVKNLYEKLSINYILKKEKENELIIKDVTSNVEVESSSNLLDYYFKQNLLDNVLRGGKPITFETKDGLVNYHVFSRKHGDPERDYNFFSLEPRTYSQGNGNFRDVLQNRRNDNLFYFNIKESNIKYFASIIQADGYNPLSIEGILFDHPDYQKFSPGSFIENQIKLGSSVEDANKLLIKTLKQSKSEIKVEFGEGYWQDHFTYLYDLIDNYLRIYPDLEKDLLFNDHTYKFFKSPVKVNDRINKTFLDQNNNVRQHNAITHIEIDNKWEEVEVNLISKLLTLVLNKFFALDYDNLGILFEANKPGWNDALNGLPGIFGSGISETIELYKLTTYIYKVISKYKEDITLIDNLSILLNKASSNNILNHNVRMSALEKYRKTLDKLTLTKFSYEEIFKAITNIYNLLKTAIDNIKKLDNIIPTYLYYDVTKYEESKNISELGKNILPLEYRKNLVLPFLEAPARYLKIASYEEARNIYLNVLNSDLYDKKLKVYKTSVNLDSHSYDLGRIRMFTKGWLERESNFLHMTYKYLYGLLYAGLYDEFYEEIKTNFTCFMDFEVYGRNPLENSSFIATSNNPDPKNHGRGFVSRLSGSTAEALSIYTYMFFGRTPFIYEDELKMVFRPIIHHTLFKDSKVKVKFYNSELTYINKGNKSIYEDEPKEIYLIENMKKIKLNFNYLEEKYAKKIREGHNLNLEIYY